MSQEVQDRRERQALWTVKTFASTLGISTRQVWKLLSMKALPDPVRLNRSVRWRASDVERFIDCGCDMKAYEKSKGEGRRS